LAPQAADSDAVWLGLVEESIQARVAMREVLLRPLAAACETVVGALGGGRKVILLGNGGSAADAQHIAAELVGRFRLERQGWPALALGDNLSSLTAIANDYGFERVFVRQLEAFAQTGDVLIALSTSGRSPNVLAALDHAAEAGLHRVVITGPAPNPAAERAEVAVCVPAPTTASIQEGTMLFLHALCHLVEEKLQRRSSRGMSARGDSPGTDGGSGYSGRSFPQNDDRGQNGFKGTIATVQPR
jgi:phosphoheptose isomerase